MDEMEAKKEGEMWLFSQIVVISRFIKISHTLLIHFKETTKCFYFLEVKNIKSDNVTMWDLDTSVSWRKDNSLQMLTL